MRGTTNHRLIFYKGKKKDHDLTAYCDSDWAGDLDDRKSTSGFVIKLNNGAISWKSSKQTCIAQSTVEAEYISAATTAKEIIWTRRFLTELRYLSPSKSIHLYINNDRARELALNETLKNQRIKYIDIRYHFI